MEALVTRPSSPIKYFALFCIISSAAKTLYVPREHGKHNRNLFPFVYMDEAVLLAGLCVFVNG